MTCQCTDDLSMDDVIRCLHGDLAYIVSPLSPLPFSHLD